MKFSVNEKDICVKIDDFDLESTLDCGQSFRWKKIKDGETDLFYGVVGNKSLKVYQDKDQVVFKNISEDDFNNFWLNYFDFSTDYNKIKSEMIRDETIRKACGYAGGIRILKQDPWEMICSFIISQNNNIPRIKIIIERLCEKYGEKLICGGYSFPSFDIINGVSEEELSLIKAGFRTKYILDAAKKISTGEVDIEKIKTIPIDEARDSLMSIKGIGPKVAECVLLFGFYKLEAFPIDVWIKRAINYYYKEGGFPAFVNKYAGVAQQYIFHYIRTCEEAIPQEYRKK